MALATGTVGSSAFGRGEPGLIPGDTVNLAVRMNKLIGDNGPGDIFVESVTYKLARAHFIFEHVGEFS